ncbi:unnamed protein product [Darwinula stevensoni]|uniref:Uncharacterized protein n=1 Tax=Darwinula stevensoni TaxID=69355 RepID=A0A7R8X5H6_9CRUS|nr:unnamed protein product [Darwinula stevensoni]CAG0884679.1 unnamed protein product [Darwinula stevensoni]
MGMCLQEVHGTVSIPRDENMNLLTELKPPKRVLPAKENYKPSEGHHSCRVTLAEVDQNSMVPVIVTSSADSSQGYFSPQRLRNPAEKSLPLPAVETGPNEDVSKEMLYESNFAYDFTIDEMYGPPYVPQSDAVGRDAIKASDVTEKDSPKTRVETAEKDSPKTGIETTGKDFPKTGVETTEKDSSKTGVETTGRDFPKTGVETTEKDSSKTGVETTGRDFPKTGVEDRPRTPQDCKLFRVPNPPLPVINKLIKSEKKPEERKTLANDVPFISSDQAENADNEDPEWTFMRKLETDDQRYRVVRELWKNTEIPNPNVNLTVHNYRKRLLLSKRERGIEPVIRDIPASHARGKTHATKRKAIDWSKDPDWSRDPDWISSCPPNKRRKTSYHGFYEELIEKLRHEYGQAYNLQQAMNMHNSWGAVFPQDRGNQYNYNYSCSYNYNYNSRHGWNHVRHNSQPDLLRRQERHIAHLRKSQEEANNIYYFYSGLKNATTEDLSLDEEQLQQLLAIEDMHDQFRKFYGGRH